MRLSDNLHLNNIEQLIVNTSVKCVPIHTFILETVLTVPGQLTPNHLTPESSHTIFGQLTLYMK